MESKEAIKDYQGCVKRLRSQPDKLLMDKNRTTELSTMMSNREHWNTSNTLKSTGYLQGMPKEQAHSSENWLVKDKGQAFNLPLLSDLYLKEIKYLLRGNFFL